MMTANAAGSVVEKELETGERLLWSGMPRQGLCFRPGDVFLVPFSLLWGGFALYWEYTVVFVQKTPFFFPLIGLLFALAGVYLIVGRFFLDSYQRSRTFYGVTSRRVIILSGVWNRELKSIDLQRLSEISLNERPDGSGNILFGSVSPFYSVWYGTSWPGMNDKLAPSFQLITNARTVYDLIRNAQRET